MFPPHLHHQKMCGIEWCCTGPEDKADAATKAMRRVGKPALDMLSAMPHPALQSLFDPFYPPGLQWYWRADFVRELSDQAIALHAERGARVPTMHSTMHLYPINGAVSQLGNHDTAFSYRDVTWAEVIVGVDPDPANRERITAWTKDYWSALHRTPPVAPM